MMSLQKRKVYWNFITLEKVFNIECRNLITIDKEFKDFFHIKLFQHKAYPYPLLKKIV